MVIALKLLDHLAGNGAGGCAVAVVVRGLAAAGLARRDLDPAACVLQQPYRGKGHSRSEQVGETGDEERGAHLGGLGRGEA